MNHFFWRLRAALILMLVLISTSAPYSSVRADTSNGYLPNEVIIKLFQSSDLDEIASDYDLNLIPIDQFGTRPIYRMQILDGASPPNRAAALNVDPRVDYAEPNYLGQAPEAQQQISWAKQQVSWAKGDENEDYVEQWAVGVIRLQQAHTVTRGAGVTVAVLDTGVDPTHPVLVDRLVAGYDFVDMDSDTSEEGIYGQNIAFGHGTHTAGVIALVAPEASIMPVRVLDPDGFGNLWVLAEALGYAMNPDGNSSTNDGADVINLSLSMPYPTNLIEDIVRSTTCNTGGCPAGHLGVVVVASAGNSGSNVLEYPAAEGVPGLLAVGASTLEDRLAAFSNNGSWVHLTAPGANILSSVPDHEYGGIWSGTSMSSPFVAGSAALVRAAYPTLNAAAVASRILSTSANIGGLIPRRIDAAAAVGMPATYISGEFRCVNSLGAVTVQNLLVPKGRSCTLNRTRVLGSVKVLEGGSLYGTYINVDGSLQVDKAASIRVTDSTIRGSVQIIESNSAYLGMSYISGDVQFFKNRNGLTIISNWIGGNLQCKENAPAPAGGVNIVRGNREDQCATL